MVRFRKGTQGRAFVLIEVLAVIAVIAVLLGLGYSVLRGARLSAKVSVAENNLRQMASAFDLFFQRYNCYPPEGASLVAVLAPYLRDLDVFKNPLADEPIPGKTVSDLYREPSLAEIDSPNRYITAFISEDGTTAVILKTGGIVERIDGLDLPLDDLRQASVILAMQHGRYDNTGGATGDDTQPGGSSDPPPSGDNPPPSGDNPPPSGDNPPPSGDEPPPSGDEPPPNDPNSGDVGGGLNLNPNNNDDFEFELRKPDGSLITRDDLHASNGTLRYIGDAAMIYFKPKGNGNQNTLTLNGQVYRVENKNRYIILQLPGGSINVDLFNSKAGKGRAMGKWWIAINARGAKIVICKCGAGSPHECECTQ